MAQKASPEQAQQGCHTEYDVQRIFETDVRIGIDQTRLRIQFGFPLP
jgi:hypothetical protein